MKRIFFVFAFLICVLTVSVLADGPVITTQPVDFYGQIGDTVTVFCRAEGQGLSYQWYIKNSSASYFSQSTIRIDTYTVTLSSTVVGRQLYCKITDSSNNVVDTNIVTIRQGDYPGGSVQITTQPLSRSVSVGDTVTFSTAAIGATWLTYQWQTLSANSWVDVQGAVSNTLTFVAQSGDNQSQYRCLVRNATSSSGLAYTNDVVLTVTPRPFSSGQMFSILGQDNFTYLETSQGDGIYHDYTDYLGYTESSSNGLTIYSNSTRSLGWVPGYNWYSIVIAIPLNIGVLSQDDSFHFQFAYSESRLTGSYVAFQFLAGSSLIKNEGRFQVNSGCSVQWSFVPGSLDVGGDTWYLINFDVSKSLNDNSRLDYLYICLGTSFSALNDGSIFKFGFTSNSSIVSGSVEDINNNILDISSVLNDISAEMETLNFDVNTINNNLVLIYNLLRNQQTASIVQQITNQIDSIITPTQEWVEIVEELHDNYVSQETELSDLGDVLDSLEKPPIEDVLPSSEAILNSDYVDMSLVADVFDPIFDRQEIVWLLLAVVGLATLSFILFGKKK